MNKNQADFCSSYLTKLFFLQESLVWKNSAHFSQENILPVQYKTFQSGVRAFVSYLKGGGGGGGGGQLQLHFNNFYKPLND